MEELINRIGNILSSGRFVRLDDEKALQAEMADYLNSKGVTFTREKRLSARDIPDFFIDDLAIEVKIKGGKMDIYRQCERYCGYDEVKALILVTNKSMALPDQINGKPAYVLNISKSWL